jgi:hypothetical protein
MPVLTDYKIVLVDYIDLFVDNSSFITIVTTDIVITECLSYYRFIQLIYNVAKTSSELSTSYAVLRLDNS